MQQMKNDTLVNIIGDIDGCLSLTDALVMHGISQRAFARSAGVNEKVIRNMLRGILPKTATTIQKIIDAIQNSFHDITVCIADIPIIYENKENRNMMLSHDAIKQFALPRNPFLAEVQHSDDVYYSEAQYYVKHALEQAMRTSGILVAIIGEVGSGKTTIKHDFIAHAQEQNALIIEPATLAKEKLTVSAVIEAILYGIAPHTKMRISGEGRTRQMHKLLQDGTKAGRTHILIIEEAQDISIPVLKMLKRLVEIKMGNKSCMSVVLIGQPELRRRLDIRQNYQLRELIMRMNIVHVDPLQNAEEIQHYVLKKFANPAQVFSSDAYEAIFQKLQVAKNARVHSGAYPLMINTLIIRALNECVTLGFEKINNELIMSL